MHISKLKAEVAAAEHILRQLHATHDVDDDMRQIVIDSETELGPAIEAALKRRAELTSMEAALKSQIEDLEARRHRFRSAVLAIDAGLLLALEVSGHKKIETAAGTIYMQANPVSVVVTDEAKIPHAYMRQREPEPDKKLIRQALLDGSRVPGCELSNRMMSVRVKTK